MRRGGAPWLRLALLVLLAWQAAVARAADAPASLDAARAEEQRLADARVVAAGRLRETEAALNEQAERVTGLAERRRAAERRLQERAATLAPLLPLAERLGLFPAETLLAVPAPPERTLRGLAVLHGLMRSVEQQAWALREEVEAVREAQRALDAALLPLRQRQAEQALLSAQLDRQLAAAQAERARTEDAAADEARRAAMEARRAETVRAAIAAMQAARERAQHQIEQDAERAERQRRDAALTTARRRQAEIAAEPGPGLRPGAGSIVPVAGPIVRRWGEATDAGPAHGIAFRAAPKGRVVAPCSGRIAFAGPFRSYGSLVILNCGRDFHYVLAGMDRLDAEPGDSVRQGEPIGVMPDWNPAEGGARPALYLELRRNGQPIDPGPFLRAGS